MLRPIALLLAAGAAALPATMATAAPEALLCSVQRSCDGEFCADNGLSISVTLDVEAGTGSVSSFGTPIKASLLAQDQGVTLLLTGPASAEILSLTADRTAFVMSSHVFLGTNLSTARLTGTCRPKG